MVSPDDSEPFFLSFQAVFGETMVEEDFDGGFLAVVVVRCVRDEAHETT